MTPLGAGEFSFFRRINLNEPAVTIDGRAFEIGSDAKDFKANGKTCESRKVVFLSVPELDSARIPAGGSASKEKGL